MSQEKKKIAVLGAAGLTGIDATRAISERLGADVIQWDRALPTNPEERKQKLAERAKRIGQYERLKELDSLDKKQAKWIFNDLEEKTGVGAILPEDKQGKVTSTDSMFELFEQKVDGIAITLGAPRKSPNDTRMKLGKQNAPVFEKTAEQLAQAIVEYIKLGHKDFVLPPIVNIGNPADTLTEVFARALHDNLIELAGKKENINYKEQLLEIARVQIPRAIMGFGGVVDAPRAKLTFAKELGISDEDAHNITLNVWGPHSEELLPDIHSATINIDGKEQNLLEYAKAKNPNVDYDDLIERATKASQAGGKAVISDYEKLGVEGQSNVFAAGAGLATMFHHITNNTQEQMLTSVCNPSFFANDNEKTWANKVSVLGAGKENAMTGRLVTLGKDGVSDIQEPPEHMKAGLAKVEASAAKNYAETVEHVRGEHARIYAHNAAFASR